MKLYKSVFRSAPTTMAAVVVVGLLAACGSGSSGPPDATSLPGELEGRSGQQVGSLPEDPDAETGGRTNSRKEVNIDVRQFQQLIPRDGINPIYNPEFIPGSPSPLDLAELVIGVEINGESKAYPIGPLRSREMVNDVVGGVPVLVTW